MAISSEGVIRTAMILSLPVYLCTCTYLCTFTNTYRCAHPVGAHTVIGPFLFPCVVAGAPTGLLALVNAWPSKVTKLLFTFLLYTSYTPACPRTWFAWPSEGSPGLQKWPKYLYSYFILGTRLLALVDAWPSVVTNV